MFYIEKITETIFIFYTSLDVLIQGKYTLKHFSSKTKFYKRFKQKKAIYIALIFKCNVYADLLIGYEITLFFFQKTFLSVTHVHIIRNVLGPNLQVSVLMVGANVSQDTYEMAETVTKVKDCFFNFLQFLINI